ncbi:MAG: D-alanyl-D-alanine carboxypeptidase/D-alanyl-D-alanine-endopeptidase [Muribaculaceae bacterium]|nr:D-alanyl-D-alanine carboxypeptidase/D-alanyl-D-alanine-endopeptidase [Muribaculaceae bacterium]
MKEISVYILLTALSVMQFIAFAGVREQAAVDKMVATPGLPQNMAVMITDLKTGETLCASGEKSPLIPASIMKAVTIASLTQEMDPAGSLETKVYVDGDVKDGVLRGNLIVVAGGDPSLNASTAPESADIIAEIISALRGRKIESIEGRLILDESIFDGPSIPASWAKGDLMHSYGTGSHGLNYRNNASGKSSVSNPGLIFERDLNRALAQAGIRIEGNSGRQGERHLLMTHQSAPLSEIMRSCMMRSDNLYAESMLRLYADATTGKGATTAGAEEEMKFWKKRGVNMAGVNIIDGSGLSRSNRVTAEMMTGVLRDMADDVDYVSYFPLAGQEGTLKRFLCETPLDSYIAMKTGSMSGIQCYAGYKLDEDFAPTHTVVVIVNDFRCDRSVVRNAVARMLLEVFED